MPQQQSDVTYHTIDLSSVSDCEGYDSADIDMVDKFFRYSEAPAFSHPSTVQLSLVVDGWVMQIGSPFPFKDLARNSLYAARMMIRFQKWNPA